MSLDACAAIVERGDPDRFLAAMSTPPSARAALLPLYAFNVEVARAPWVTQEPLIAEMRLQWWRDALEEIAAGRPVRRHEVTGPLADILDAEGARVLGRLVEARRHDIGREPFTSEHALRSYLDATGGGLMWVAALALGTEPRAETDVRRVGRAGGLANWFLAAPRLKAAGRAPLPDETPQAVAALAGSALVDLAAARVPRAARPATRAAWRAGPLLRQAHRNPARVLEGGLAQSEAARRFGLLIRALGGR